MKKIVGALMLGAALTFPVVMPDYLSDNVTSVACAKDKRVRIYTTKKIDDWGYPEYEHYELEPDSFGEMEIRGIHYMSFWVTEIGEYFNNLFFDKDNWGSYHFLAKFYPDGSYGMRRMFYNKSDAKHRENLNLAKNWEIALEKDTKKHGKDYFEPSNWSTGNINSAMVKYIKANYPALVQQNVAYYAQEKALLSQREAAAKQAAEQVEKQKRLTVKNKLEASAASIRNEGFIKVVSNETSYEAHKLGTPLIYKNVVSYTDWYIDPANIHYSVGDGQWAGTERYDVLVASVTEKGSVHKQWFVYMHDKNGVWAQFELETNDSPLGRSFSDIGSYAITNFSLEPGNEARDRAGMKYGYISAIMQSVLNYRNGAGVNIIHAKSEGFPDYLEPAAFDALPFPVEQGNYVVYN